MQAEHLLWATSTLLDPRESTESQMAAIPALMWPIARGVLELACPGRQLCKLAFTQPSQKLQFFKLTVNDNTDKATATQKSSLSN